MPNSRLQLRHSGERGSFGDAMLLAPPLVPLSIGIWGRVIKQQTNSWPVPQTMFESIDRMHRTLGLPRYAQMKSKKLASLLCDWPTRCS